MAKKKRVLPECDHEWELYRDVPGGEDPLRYRKCKKCGIMAGVLHAGYLTETAAPETASRVKPLKCTNAKCKNFATGRNWGRTSLGRIRWVCETHRKDRPSSEGTGR